VAVPVVLWLCVFKLGAEASRNGPATAALRSCNRRAIAARTRVPQPAHTCEADSATPADAAQGASAAAAIAAASRPSPPPPPHSQRAGARRAGVPPAVEVEEAAEEDDGAAGQLVGRDLPDPRLACRSWSMQRRGGVGHEWTRPWSVTQRNGEGRTIDWERYGASCVGNESTRPDGMARRSRTVRATAVK
jgi:hypothetical protein